MACNDTPTTPTDIAGPSLARTHFIGDPSCTQVGGNLVCDFKVAGLGNVSEVDITVQAPFQCAKSTDGNLDVRQGGLASASQSNVPVTNGQITIENFVVSGGRLGRTPLSRWLRTRLRQHRDAHQQRRDADDPDHVTPCVMEERASASSPPYDVEVVCWMNLPLAALRPRIDHAGAVPCAMLAPDTLTSQ